MIYQTDEEFAGHPIHPYGCYFLSLIAAVQPRFNGEVEWQLGREDVLKLYDLVVADGAMYKDCTVQRGADILGRTADWLGRREEWRQLAGQTSTRLQKDAGEDLNRYRSGKIIVSRYVLHRPGEKTWVHFVLDRPATTDAYGEYGVLYDPWVYADAGKISRTRREGKLQSVRVYERAAG